MDKRWMLTDDTRVGRLLQWEQGGQPGPWEISVFPTNRCNQKCRICWERSAEERYGPTMYDNEIPDERLLQLVDEAADLGVREWCIVGGGEPMVRGDIVMAMCERIRARKMNGCIHTNATLFTEEHLNALTSTDWQQLKVSLDGPTPESNDAVRSDGSFERTTRTLRLLKRLKAQHHTLLPLVSLHPVINRLNYDRLTDMVILADELGCCGCHFSRLVPDHEVAASFALDTEMETALPNQLREAAQLADRLELEHNLWFLLGVSGKDSPTSQSTDEPNKPPILNALCHEPWLNLTITANGKAGPCCVFYDEDAQSIQDSSLYEVWTGPYMKQVRDAILTQKPMDYCVHCPSHIQSRIASVVDEFHVLENRADRWKQMSTIQRTAFLAHQFVGNLCRNGFRQTMHRTRRFLTGSQ